MALDVAAAMHVFNETDARIWQMPRDIVPGVLVGVSDASDETLALPLRYLLARSAFDRFPVIVLSHWYPFLSGIRFDSFRPSKGRTHKKTGLARKADPASMEYTRRVNSNDCESCIPRADPLKRIRAGKGERSGATTVR